jgi:hypothetical protein
MRLNGEAETNPQMSAEWHTVGFQHRDSYPLQVLAQILNGRTGRLFKGLVLPADAVATNVTAAQQSRKYAGSFAIEGECKEGKKPEELEKGVYAEVEKLQKELVPAQELQKVKNNFAANSFRRLSSNMAILFGVISNEGLGDWREINEGPRKIQAVSAEDVRRVAQTYLTKENRGVAVFTRKGGAAAAPSADEAALASLPEQARPMVKQLLGRVSTEKDPEKLKAMVAQLESQSAAVPPEMKQGLDLVLLRAKDRLAELAKGEKK